MSEIVAFLNSLAAFIPCGVVSILATSICANALIPLVAYSKLILNSSLNSLSVV